ncbi:MAG: PQQ-binding-like beta-propeller repeat protein [Bacteroidetes bacterium]|nr:PQQ-binding-like beta-propeller repeat protein [Bacteroidota bacterium]
MTLRIKILVILPVLLIISCTKPISLKRIKLDAQGVTSFGNSPERNFFVDLSIGDSLALKWTAEINGSFDNTTVSVFNDYVFVPDLSGRIYVLDKADGLINGYEIFKGEIPSAIVIELNKCMFVHNEQKEDYFSLYYFNFTLGKVHERILIKGKCVTELLKLNNGIILLTEEGNLYKFDFIGNKIWKYESGEYSLSSPASDGKIVMWGNTKGEIIAVDAESGNILYKNKVTDRFESDITISGNESFIGDSKGNLFSINNNNGSVNWKFKTSEKIKSLPVLNSNTVFINNLQGSVYSINLSDGKLNWELKTGGLMNAAPLLFNDYLLQPDVDQKIYLIDVNKGIIRKQLNFDERVKLSPVYFDSTIYIGTDRGIIYAYETPKLK